MVTCLRKTKIRFVTAFNLIKYLKQIESNLFWSIILYPIFILFTEEKWAQ